MRKKEVFCCSELAWLHLTLVCFNTSLMWETYSCVTVEKMLNFYKFPSVIQTLWLTGISASCQCHGAKLSFAELSQWYRPTSCSFSLLHTFLQCPCRDILPQCLKLDRVSTVNLPLISVISFPYPSCLLLRSQLSLSIIVTFLSLVLMISHSLSHSHWSQLFSFSCSQWSLSFSFSVITAPFS